MAKKKKAKEAKTEEFTIHIDMTTLEVEECGYKATFTNEKHIEFVSHVLENLAGYKRLVKTLSKAMDLIEKSTT